MNDNRPDTQVLSEEYIEVSLLPGQPPDRYRLRMILDRNTQQRMITMPEPSPA